MIQLKVDDVERLDNLRRSLAAMPPGQAALHPERAVELVEDDAARLTIETAIVVRIHVRFRPVARVFATTPPGRPGPFRSGRCWKLGVGLVAAYVISRGIAKAGSSERYVAQLRD